MNSIICQNCLTPQPETRSGKTPPTNCFNCRHVLQTAATGSTGRPLLEMHDYASEGEAALCQQHASKAAGAMLVVAIVQFIAGALFYFVPSQRIADSQQSFLTAFVVGIGVVYLLFYFWALVQPLPAAFAGLVLYAMMIVGDGIYDPASLTRGVILKGLVIVVLTRAIGAALRYRTLVSAHPNLGV